MVGRWNLLYIHPCLIGTVEGADYYRGQALHEPNSIPPETSCLNFVFVVKISLLREFYNDDDSSNVEVARHVSLKLVISYELHRYLSVL